MRTYRRQTNVVRTPKRPFEKERIDHELKICGEYGLRNKFELWRLHTALSHIRKTARYLLTLPANDTTRIFQGAALLRRLTRLGLLNETKQKLDYALSLSVNDFLNRRLQTIVFRNGLAKSIHHARSLVQQGHIRVGKSVVNKPGFMVRVDSEKHIDFAPTSPFGGGKPGRVKKFSLRRKAAAAAAAASGQSDS